ncbi:MAG: hypothetical protein IT430_06405 [Phycisphaerales bacterium]|nr:hypothetical protein [Phycisphaerales bacterium]
MKSHVCFLCSAAMLASLAPLGGANVAQDPANRQPTTVNRQPVNRDDAAPSILHRMEGVWKVEARVNPLYWDRIKNALDRNGQNDSFRRENTGGPNAQDPNRRPGDGMIDDSPRKFRGMAEARMILNDQILGEQTYLIADHAPATDPNRPSTTPGDTTPGTNPDRTPQTDPQPNPNRIVGNERSIQSLSFFAFDPQHDAYTAVFMSDRDGEIHYRTGRYDVAARKIVFEDHQPTMLDRTPTRITPGNRERDLNEDDTPGIDKDRGLNEDNSGGFEREPATTRSRELYGNTSPFGENVRVVVEIISDDQHRVTMYAGDVPGTETPAIRPSTTPGQTNPRTNPTQTPDREFNANEPLPANVVYQAIYTRSSEQEVGEFRDLLRKAEEGKDMDNHRNNQEYNKP